jgi:hypothetical protein
MTIKALPGNLKKYANIPADIAIRKNPQYHTLASDERGIFRGTHICRRRGEHFRGGEVCQAD